MWGEGTIYTLPPWVKAGARLSRFVREGHPYNCTIHVRGIIDDNYVVWRHWIRGKGWIYKIEWGYTFLDWIEQGWVTPYRRPSRRKTL